MPVRTAASRQLLLGAILGAGLAGCDSQVEPSYPGEPIVELRGTAIGFRTDDAAGSVAIAWNSNAGPEIPSGPVTSESLRAHFTADLTIDVLARPPEAAFFAVEGEGVRIAEGYLYLVRAGAGRPPAGLGGRERATLAIPGERDYVIFQGGADGAVVAEVGAHDGERHVSLRPGPYFLRGRARDRLLEGPVTLRAGERRGVDEESLDQVAFARLVRKGLGVRPRAHDVEVGYMVRTPLWSGASACQGPLIATALDLPVLSFSARAFGCLGSFRNEFLSASSNEFGAELAVLHSWDVRSVSLSAARSWEPRFSSSASTRQAPRRPGPRRQHTSVLPAPSRST